MTKLTKEEEIYIERFKFLQEYQGSYPASGSPSASIEVVQACLHTPPFKSLWEIAIKNFPFAVQDSYEEAWSRFEESLKGNPRLELYLYVGQDPKGYANIVLECDAHVGWCWSVQWNFVHPDYRGSSLSKLIFKILNGVSSKTNLPYAYSKMLSDNSLKIVYKGLKNN